MNLRATNNNNYVNSSIVTKKVGASGSLTIPFTGEQLLANYFLEEKYVRPIRFRVTIMPQNISQTMLTAQLRVQEPAENLYMPLVTNERRVAADRGCVIIYTIPNSKRLWLSSFNKTNPFIGVVLNDVWSDNYNVMITVQTIFEAEQDQVTPL